MTGCEKSLLAGAVRCLPGVRNSLVLLTVVWLAACSNNSNPPTDMGPQSDMPQGDGGIKKMQQPGCSIDEWCWQFPQPQGSNLRSVWGSSTNDAWAVGDAGALIHYDGVQWKAVVSPTTSTLWSISGSSASDVWAVGDGVTVLHYDGQNWSLVPVSGASAISGSLFSVWSNGPDDVWMVGTNGLVVRKSGSSLSAMPQSATTSTLFGVWATSSKMFAVGPGGTLLTYNGSFSSMVIPGASSQILLSITGISADELFVSTAASVVFHFSSNTWNQVQVCTNLPPKYASGCNFTYSFGLNGLWSKGNDVFAVGEVLYPDNVTKDSTQRFGTVKKWDGSKFADVPGALPIGLFGVWGTAPNNLFMVGVSGTIVRFDGVTFTSSSIVDSLTGVSGKLLGLSGSSADDFYAVGEWGATLKWSGNQWQNIPNSSYIQFQGVAGTSDNLWSVGKEFAMDATMPPTPRLYRMQSNAWQPVSTSIPGNQRAIWISGNDGFTVGEGDTAMRRDNTGTWLKESSIPNTGTTLRAVWGPDVGHLWIVGGGDNQNQKQNMFPGKILFYNGSSTLQMDQPNNGIPTNLPTLSGVWGTDASHVWAVGDQGQIWITVDGMHWVNQRQAAPERPALRGIWGTGPNDVYAVGDFGTLLHYDGKNWQPQDSGTSISFYSVWSVGKDLYISGINGTVLHRRLP